MRLLLIEDEPSAVELITRLLDKFASRIDQASRLATGLTMAGQNDYDVVLLDLRLLDSERDQTIAAIPEVKRLANAPVVVVTGWPGPDMKERCLAAGADAFVNKSELVSAILMAVQVALSNAPEKVREPSFAAHVAMLHRILTPA